MKNCNKLFRTNGDYPIIQLLYKMFTWFVCNQSMVIDMICEVYITLNINKTSRLDVNKNKDRIRATLLKTEVEQPI